MKTHYTFSISANVKNLSLSGYYKNKKKPSSSHDKCFVMSTMFKTRLGVLLSPLDYAQTRCDVVGGDSRREISFSFGLEYSRDRRMSFIHLDYAIFQKRHG